MSQITAKNLSIGKRLKLILETPEIELDGEAYLNNYKLNDANSIKKFIFQKLRLDSNGKNIEFVNFDTNVKIIISRNSAGKLARHFGDGEIYQKTIIHIPKIIECMQFLKDFAPDKDSFKFNKYSYYVTGVNMYGKSYTILSTIGTNNDEVYSHKVKNAHK